MRRIVSRAMGSWKYQKAYGVVQYIVQRRKRDGALMWVSQYNVVKKASEPQLRRMGLNTLPHGSLHHTLVAEEYIASVADFPLLVA